MNRKIKQFGFDGVIADDSVLPRMRLQYEKMIEDSMRDSGYVPVRDLDPIFIIKYNEENNSYQFSISIHGIYVGKKKAQQYDGYVGQRLMPKSN